MDRIKLSPNSPDGNIQEISSISENYDNESVKNIKEKKEIVQAISTSVTRDPLKQENEEENKIYLNDVDSDGLFELENDVIKTKSNIDFSNFLTADDVSKVVELIEKEERDTYDFESLDKSESLVSSSASSGKLIINENQDDYFDDDASLAERVASAFMSPSEIKILDDFPQPSTSQQYVYEYLSDHQNSDENWEELYKVAVENDVHEKVGKNEEQNDEIKQADEKKNPVQLSDDIDDEDDEKNIPAKTNLRQKNPPKIKKKPRKNQGVTPEEKIRVITLARENPGWSIGKLREKSRCAKLRQRRQIFAWEGELNLGDNSKEKRQLEMINNWVISKFIQYKKKKQKITNMMLRDWGLEASKKYKNRDFKFLASEGWICRFKKANKIIGHWQNLYFSGARDLNNQSSLVIDNEEVLLDDDDDEEKSKGQVLTPQKVEQRDEQDAGPSAFSSYARRPDESSWQYPGFSYGPPSVNMPPSAYYDNSYQQYQPHWGFQQPPPNYYYPQNYYDPRFYNNNGNWYWDGRQNYIDLTDESSNYQMQNQYVHRASSDGNSTHSPDIYQGNRQVACKVVYQAEVHRENEQVEAHQINRQVVRQEMQTIDQPVIQNIGGEKLGKSVMKNSNTEKFSNPVIVNTLSRNDAEKYFSSERNEGKTTWTIVDNC